MGRGELQLAILIEMIRREGYELAELQDIPADFGVDSGQFGIFDASIYDGDSEYGQPGFYNDCCEATLTHDRCGTVGDLSQLGFVSSSGYGDGGYFGLGAFDENNNLVKFRITFIEELSDEDREWLDADLPPDKLDLIVVTSLLVRRAHEFGATCRRIQTAGQNILQLRWAHHLP
jgi:hypothetical protein